MRLLLLNHNCRYGGTYYRAMPLAEQMARRGHEVTLLTVSPANRWTPTWSIVNNVRLGEMPNLAQSYSGEGYGPLDNLVRISEACWHRYDIVHMFDHKPNATLAGFPARLRGARLVADWADWWGGPGGINDVPKRRFPAVGRFEEWWEVQSKLWADGVVTISRVLEERAREIGCSPNRILYLPTGAATDRIQPRTASEARAALGIPCDRHLIGFVGMGQGDLDIVMAALQDLPQVWLMVVGKRNSKVLAQAQSFGVADRLWQVGFVPDDQISMYLGCADIMCLPMTDRASNRGRLPNKLLDYMCAGRPTVVSSVGDAGHIVSTYHTGLVADNGGFSEAIRALLEDSDLRNEMGTNARRTALDVFGWPHLTDRLQGFYENLTAN